MNAYQILLTALPAAREWVQIHQSGGNAKVYASPSGCYCLGSPKLDDPRHRRPAVELLGKRAWGSLTEKQRSMRASDLGSEVIGLHCEELMKTIERFLDRVANGYEQLD